MTNRSTVLLGSELSGLPVVTLDSGEDVAEARDVVFDVDRHELIGFTLNERGWLSRTMSEVLPIGNVAAIGRDAIMVATGDECSASTERHTALGDDAPSRAVIGTEVFTAGGTRLGAIDDVVIATGAQRCAVGYRVETGDGHVFVPIGAQMSLSDDSLIVPVEAQDFVHRDLAGFGASIEVHRHDLDVSSTVADDNNDNDNDNDGSR